MKNTLTVKQAEAIYDVLVAEVGAIERHRVPFVHTQTREHCAEFRFMGSLGFGGKFWRNTGFRPDGSWGEVWYVNTYREDETSERVAAIERANARLEALRAESDQ